MSENFNLGKSSEAQEQATVVEWAAWESREHPELALLYHVPNGGSRHPAEAAHMKAQGVKPGVPDLCLPVPSGEWHGLYIEMKYGKNKTSERQDWWLMELRRQGYRTAVCYSADAAIKTICEHLNISTHGGET